MKKILKKFSITEILLWTVSICLIVTSFCLFDRKNYLVLSASLVGATSLIFNAKGNPIGQALMIVFSVLYGIISFTYRYYGEMITYLGMTAPMALAALISWLKNPYKGEKSQVKVNTLKAKELWLLAVLTTGVTGTFYFILRTLGTSNLIPSTVSVTTSFVAAYLTLRRSPYFAIAYAANDAVLIVLWSMAAATDNSYVSVIICFAVFLVNDIYGFINWRKMQTLQSKEP
ncbi:MAG: nicotinamide riboside transporter PnuC [Corallococcus sp.]|nr:nicotinamide riboside transporter PnuC [Corallococcus sp.]MCM1359811.1 nicotinamide riboside transporter PnuC [Corallococcus sp.]MCM1395245.1 nicotinamide riboside transporter PnuC [Corallococcus sp.]